mgnify:CR=1 FL=1
MRVGDFIRHLRKNRKMTQAELAKKLGVAPTAVSAWERNENKPLMDKLTAIAEIFEIPVTKFFELEEFGGVEIRDSKIIPIFNKVELIDGEVVFGDISGYEFIPSEWANDGEHFFLRSQDDSMIGARIQSGDLLLIRQQSEIENGEIALASIGDEVVLRRVYLQNDTYILQSENPKYPPILRNKSDVTIIGRLVLNMIMFI